MGEGFGNRMEERGGESTRPRTGQTWSHSCRLFLEQWAGRFKCGPAMVPSSSCCLQSPSRKVAKHIPGYGPPANCTPRTPLHNTCGVVGALLSQQVVCNPMLRRLLFFNHDYLRSQAGLVSC